MRIVNRVPDATADVSSGSGTAWLEVRNLVLLATLLAVAMYLSIGYLVDFAVTRTSFGVEARLFGGFSLPQADGEQGDEPLQRARSVLNRLTSAPGTPPLPFRLVLMQRPEPNAFAFPGGCIGVTEGLVTQLTDDIELAFVLGHELGHFQHRDHLRGLGRAIGTGVTFSALFGGPAGDNTLTRVLQFVLRRNYSRRQEAAADRFAVELVFRTFGKTNGIERLFEILEGSADVPAWAYMFATHPAPGDRIRELRAYAEQLEGESAL